MMSSEQRRDRGDGLIVPALIDKIETEAERIRKQHDEAVLSFRHPASVNSYRDFALVMTQAAQHLHAATVAKARLPDDYALDMARQTLTAVFREQGGWEQCSIMAMNGKDGGLLACVRALADSMKRQQITKWTDYCLDQAINPMSFDERMAIATEILRDWKQHLPAGIRERNPAEIAHQYRAIIRTVAHLVEVIRSRLGHYDA
ncbi:MAG: hypothetical protein IT379_30295 [Deltaproteobacteria bacterium]|nr:hypothetical protein [Deltaproteobacteria bacterium]